MKKAVWIAVAFVAGMLVSGHPVVAQQITRIYGTVSGNAIALLADSGGILRVKCE